jgi:hypothetical protein
MRSVNYSIVKAVAASLVLLGAFSGVITRAQTSPGLPDESAFSLPQGVVGVEYQYQFQADGGVAPFNWRVSGGELPPGIKLESSGKLSGAPTRAQRDAYSFVVEVSDDSRPPQKFTQAFLLFIQAKPLRIVLNQPKLTIVAPKQTETSPSVTAGAAGPSLNSNIVAATVTESPVSNAPTSNRGEAAPPKPPAAPVVKQAHTKDQDLRVTATKDATLKVLVNGLPVKLIHEGQNVDTVSVSSDAEIAVRLAQPLKDEAEVVVEQSLNGLSTPSAVMTVQTPEPNWKRTGELATAIVGFEQAGASAASSSQHFFFNFFISRPLPVTWMGKANGFDGKDFDDTFGPRLRWWGNVRIASVPQQVSTPVAQFVTNFPQEIGALKVNELAQAAEYMSGLEYRLTGWKGFFGGQSEDSHQQFSLGFFVGAGAVGPLEPKETLRVFEVPPAGSAIAERFFNTYPQARGRQFIGFVSPDRDRFNRQYSAGLRLTTFYSDENKTRLTSPPAMISVSLGQNEVVTGGTMRGVVARLEAFYPLPIGGERKNRFSSIYLFGAAQKRLSKVTLFDPFILNPVTLMTKSPCPTPAPQDSITPCVILQDFISNGVTVTTPSNRDIYKIGVGMELIRLLKGKE